MIDFTNAKNDIDIVDLLVGAGGKLLADGVSYANIEHALGLWCSVATGSLVSEAMEQLVENDHERLAKIIRANPKCEIIVDNDAWFIYAAEGTVSQYSGGNGEIAASRDFPQLGVSYGYGALEVLAYMQGMTVERV